MANQTIVLIVAAGEGERLGGPTPKPYVMLDGMGVLRRSILAFVRCPSISGIQVVIHKNHAEYYKKATQGLDLMPPVIGGATRQESVQLGLAAIKSYAPQKVLIHDAARPLVSNELINRVVEELDDYKAVLPALPVADSLKRVEDDTVQQTIDRTHVWAAQTPQGFRFDIIYDLHERFKGDAASDDVALAEKAGVAVHVVEGDVQNQKLTSREDLHYMQRMLEKSYETRVGQGVDVHRFVPFASDVTQEERHVMLCGVKVPHGFFLEGHSDADAGLHAITDALLGAIGAQDIGYHFSPKEERWKGADSSQFLRHAASLLAGRGGRVVHVDVTLICEQPKITTYREAMIKQIASTLGINPERVSVKATTTEGLGFTGRGEGLAAQAMVTVQLPKEVI